MDNVFIDTIEPLIRDVHKKNPQIRDVIIFHSNLMRDLKILDLTMYIYMPGHDLPIMPREIRQQMKDSGWNKGGKKNMRDWFA